MTYSYPVSLPTNISVIFRIENFLQDTKYVIKNDIVINKKPGKAHFLIQNFDSKFKFKIWIKNLSSNMSSKFKFKIEIQNLSSKLAFKV